MVNRSEIEVMAPAGNFESLAAAIQGGANSVYFGVGHLNMRAKSTVNFTPDDIPDIVAICSTHHVKTYLTVNTVLYDQDIEAMQNIIDVATGAGISAIIASDQAAMLYARKKGVEVHLSTQLNIGNTQSLLFYSQWADVVVLARELTLNQVKEIAQNIDSLDIKGPSGKKIKIELFAHGALCMAISGKCYLSLHEANASANRGSCIQICRRSYTATDNETGAQLEIDNEYIMSPKDLCTISFLDKVIDAGVRVLKIEGRARSAEYVKTVTQCYSEAVNSLVEDNFNQQKIDGWMDRLSAVFNRGFWDGYYLGRRLGEWTKSYGNRATERKMYVGKITNYFSKLHVAEVAVEASELYLNDKIFIIGPTTGVIESVVTEIQVDEKSTSYSPKGVKCSIPVAQKVRRSDKLYRIIKSE
ncbi:MAG: peptidase U32 family protein [Bacteroidales bacterium]